MPQIVLHLILLSNHKKSKKERKITEIFLHRIPFSLKNYFCLGGVWLIFSVKLLLCTTSLSPSVTSPLLGETLACRSVLSSQFSMLLPQKEPKALRSDFTPLPRAPLLGELSNEVRLRGCRKDNLYHLNPHFLKYRIRFPACQRAGFRLRWAARCHAWMAVYWGTR